jgi:hypothetical protein
MGSSFAVSGVRQPCRMDCTSSMNGGSDLNGWLRNAHGTHSAYLNEKEQIPCFRLPPNEAGERASFLKYQYTNSTTPKFTGLEYCPQFSQFISPVPSPGSLRGRWMAASKTKTTISECYLSNNSSDSTHNSKYSKTRIRLCKRQ